LNLNQIMLAEEVRDGKGDPSPVIASPYPFKRMRKQNKGYGYADIFTLGARGTVGPDGPARSCRGQAYPHHLHL
jgi:hypothetical protein